MTRMVRPPGSGTGPPAAAREFSAREVAVYDRQMRLWGVATQRAIS